MKKAILFVLFTSIVIQGSAQQANQKDNYQKAFNELRQMLKSEIPLSFKRAVFITENAFLDNQLIYEGFTNPIDDLVKLTRAVAVSDGLDYDLKDRQQVLLSASIFRVMKDSLFFQTSETSTSF